MSPRWLALAIVAVPLLSGCKAASPPGGDASRPPWPVRVEVDAHALGLAPTSMDHALDRALADRPLLARADGNPGALTAHVWLGEARDPEGGGPDLRVALELEAPSDLRGALGGPAVEAHISIERSSGGPSHESIGEALGRAFGVVEAQLAIAMADAVEIERVLHSEDRGVRLVVLEWIGRSGGTREPSHRAVLAAQSTVAAVLGALSESDAELRQAALGALAVVGDQRHVPAVIAALDLHDDASATAAYRTLGALGGEQAEQLLDFAARNEDDPVRQKAAQRALEALREPIPAIAVFLPRGHRG